MWLEGELSANSYGHGIHTGTRLSALYDLNDHWRIGGDVEHHSRRTPLRALRSGVSANMAGGWARWRAHERREWWFSLSQGRFSDHNQRLEFSLDGSERIYSRPRLQLDLLLSLSGQRNSQDDDRLYFNPKRAWMLLPALRANHLLHRRDAHAWEHTATVSAGAFQQRFYGRGGVLALSYGQRYRYRDVFEAGLTLNAISRPYDGNRERETQLMLDMVMRF